MKKILGLDLGTTSIGWAYVNEAEKPNEKSSITRLGVRVVPLSVDEKNNFEKGKDITTNADRTRARGMRRNLQRFKLRREALVECLKRNGLITDDSALYEESNNSTFRTYRMRAAAVTEEISLEDLGRVLLMINKKRGYKSSRKVNKEEAGDGVLINGMDVAKELYRRQITPGEYMFSLLSKGKKVKPEFYRSDLLAELKAIWVKQQSFYPDVLTNEMFEEIQGKSRTQTSTIFYKQKLQNTALNKGKDKRLQAFSWRADAVNKQLPLDEVLSAICDVNGSINGSSEKLGMISDRSKLLYFNELTIGQYLMQRLENNPNASLTNIIFYRQDYMDEFDRIWATQSKYHTELTQQLGAELRGIIFYQRGLKSCKGLVDYCELEHQEKEIVTSEGKQKTVTISSKVCPRSSPFFQEFKIWQKVNDIVVSPKNGRRKPKKNQQPSLFEEDTPLGPRYLNAEERNILFRELSIKAKLSKREILELLFENPKALELNCKEIEGNKTGEALFHAYQDIISETGNGDYDFRFMPAEDVYTTVEGIFKGLDYKTDFLYFDSSLEGKEAERQPYYRLWHLLYSYAGDNSKTGDDSLIEKISDLIGMEKDYARILSKVTFIPEYGNLSAKAIRKILPFMMQGDGYSVACLKAGYRHSSRSLTKEEKASKTYSDHINALKRNSLRNPVVEKILNQMINVINAVAIEYGKPDEIRIELARELKKSKEEREEMTASIDKMTKESELVRVILQKDFKIAHVTRNDILRYRLYEELKGNGYRTLYSNTYIPREEIFDGKFDIEHIIPKAKAFDDSFSNKTLELSSINKEKSDATAYDYILAKYDEEGVCQYEQRVNDLFKNHAICHTKMCNLLRRTGDIPKDFLERDLRNTQYIAKKAIEILEDYVPTVTSTIGSITSLLRRDWQLVDVMKELNWEKYDALGMTETFEDHNGNRIGHILNWSKRNDNRHHAMDALTIAFTKPSIIQYLNNLNARSDKGGSIYGIQQKELHRDKNNHLVFNSPIPLDEFRAKAKEELQRILVSYKAKNKVVTQNVNKSKKNGGINRKIQLTPRGQLHKETVYGRIKQYATKMVPVNAKMTAEVIKTVAAKVYREALQKRIEEFGGDPKKAFKTLDKNPIWLHRGHTQCVTAKVKVVTLEPVFTIKKAIGPDLKLDKVIDPKIREILQRRLDEFGGEAADAFSNLDKNPIWLNKERGIAIRRVKLRDNSNATPLRDKRNVAGQLIRDVEGKSVPNDYVSTGNNHHAAIFMDSDGNLQEHVVSFYEATERAVQGLPVVDRDYNKEQGWKFLFTLKQNEYFVFSNEKTGFNPADIDLMDEKNYPVVSENLFRVQKMSKKNYYFRHHLETTVDVDYKLRGVTWISIRALNQLKRIVKVRINHLGKIVQIGEYQ